MTSCVRLLPETSSSVRLRNRSISARLVARRFTKRKVIKDCGFLTSDNDCRGTFRCDELLPIDPVSTAFFAT